MTSITHEQLDRDVASLRAVGGIYEILAQIVENQNRPRCVD